MIKIDKNSDSDELKITLRLNDDVPSQSDTMPLFNIYFLGCMFFSLFAMIWFFLMNILNEEKELSNCLRCSVLKVCCVFDCTSQSYRKNKKVLRITKRNDYLEGD